MLSCIFFLNTMKTNLLLHLSVTSLQHTLIAQLIHFNTTDGIFSVWKPYCRIVQYRVKQQSCSGRWFNKSAIKRSEEKNKNWLFLKDQIDQSDASYSEWLLEPQARG